MVISSRPKQKDNNDSTVDMLINKGGSVAAKDKDASAKKDCPILVRVPPDVLEQIDLIVSKRRIKTARHTWLLEAIYEKLDKESK